MNCEEIGVVWSEDSDKESPSLGGDWVVSDRVGEESQGKEALGRAVEEADEGDEL